jgi:AAA+ ATPase superfamily predicted ATPase
VKREFPVTETSSKKSIYRLDDGMFRFWYRFVFPNMSGIVSGIGNAIFDFEVRKELSAFMGSVFEEICTQYLIEQAKENTLPFPPGKIGKWWGNNPHEKRQEEIDIMSYRKDDAIFCECKWTNTAVNTDALAALTRKSGLFHYKNTWLWLFAKTGFTDQLVTQSKGRNNLRLVRFEDMFG